jgi:hypothetical protein
MGASRPDVSQKVNVCFATVLTRKQQFRYPPGAAISAEAEADA